MRPVESSASLFLSGFTDQPGTGPIRHYRCLIAGRYHVLLTIPGRTSPHYERISDADVFVGVLVHVRIGTEHEGVKPDRVIDQCDPGHLNAAAGLVVDPEMARLVDGQSGQPGASSLHLAVKRVDQDADLRGVHDVTGPVAGGPGLLGAGHAIRLDAEGFRPGHGVVGEDQLAAPAQVDGGVHVVVRLLVATLKRAWEDAQGHQVMQHGDVDAP